ncbi:tRNA(Ile)-lysidine synthetase [Synechococcus sp. BOUM118]|nr:tRNA(Ile)-lysidine synthetase [Synechococcus sp. BOUM118]
MGEQRPLALAWSPWHDRLHRRLQQQPKLLPERQPLLLAVSGGQDSMALLVLLQELQRLHHWPLNIWHGDHGWHSGSAVIAADLRSWCQRRDLPIQVDQAPQGSTASEASARHWRYSQLRQRAEELGADVVTGHTASDRAETLLLQLARGTDLAGLGALRPVRPISNNSPNGAQLRRPLLGFSRADTSAMCRDLQVPIWQDPSNQSSDFARNRIRAEVLPVLEQLHPGCSQRMANLAERTSQLRDTQQELIHLALQPLRTSTGLDRRRLGALQPSTRRQLLVIWLAQQGVTALNAALLEQLTDRLALSAAGGSCDLPGGWRLQWQGDNLSLQPPAAGH